MGVCIVEAPELPDRDDSFILAVRRAHQHKINPGGQCKGTLIPEDLYPQFEGHKNKFFSLEDAKRLFDADTEKNLKKEAEEVDSSDDN